MIKPPVKGSGPTRITLQFRTFEISSVAVNRPVNTGREAKDVVFEDAMGREFVTIQSILTSWGLPSCYGGLAVSCDAALGYATSPTTGCLLNTQSVADRVTSRANCSRLYAGRDGKRSGAILAAKSLNTRTGLGTK